MEKQYQVVIVGGGPVGVALAVELGLRGVSCALVERRREPQRIPKGQNLSQRTLEHFHCWGIADALRAARIMPTGYPISGITAYGNLMSPYWYAPPQREIVRSYYFEDTERLPQYETEKVLRARMAEVANVDSRIGWSAESVAQDDDGARVTIVEAGGTGREVLTADYVVGCDGAHSTVRDQIGIARSGSDFDQVMVLAVFRSRALHEGLKRFPERATYNALHPDLKGYWQFFGRIDVGEGWFFHAPVPADTTTENYDFKGLIQKAAGFAFDCTFDHVGFWDLRVAVAETYRVGRVFIAGDAAHSHPPYGSFGLNNGLEDVANLGWKLAARLAGWGSDALLDSYGDERRPIFKETGEDFIASRIRADHAFLERYNPDRDRAEFELAWKKRQETAGNAVQSYEPNYEGSSVVVGPPNGVCSAHGTHMFRARAGHHLAPQKLSSGRNVFEELGTGFTLLAFDAEAGAVPAFEQAARSLNIPLTVIRDSYAGGRDAYEARLTLVRPDQYVVWTGDRPPGDVRGLLGKVTGRA
ncbi:MAG TPA: FAD-dependent monooxygenase [Stellaceae bacterium]|nr:FAD-dependent monooxygenase [Stellaceae bacterium]